MSSTAVVPEGVDLEEKEILIVASKLKKYVKSKGDINTASEVMERLSDIVRVLCDEAIAHATRDNRKTLKARDFRNV